MSFEASSWALNEPTTTGTARLVLIGIATHADDKGCNAWPSVATLARYANVTERNVQKALRALEDAGLVTITLSDGGTRHTRGDRRPNLYRLNMSDGASLPTPRTCDGVSETVSRGVATDAHGVSLPTPELSLEPTTEPSTTTGAAAPTAENPDVERLCNLLADLIVENGSKRPTITQRWRDACRLMIDRDGRAPEQIERAIRWAQADEFWRANILSMPTLRKQYDRLRLAAARPARANGVDKLAPLRRGQALMQSAGGNPFARKAIEQ